MPKYDAEIRVKASVDNSQIQRLQLQVDKAADKASVLGDKLKKLGTTKIPTKEYEEVRKQIEATEVSLNRLLEKKERFRGSRNSSSWSNLNAQIEELQNSLPYMKGELQDLVDTGKAFTLGKDSKEYADLSKELDYAQRNLQVLTTRQRELEATQSHTAQGFDRMDQAAKRAFRTVRNGAKTSNGLLSTMAGRLKGITLSLFVFNWITRGFNAMVSSMKQGFQNLAHYSKDYNAQMSALKSSCAQLKNSLAAAFAPIVITAIPYLTRLVNWLVRAAEAVAQFLAVLQGKHTYTRAKKQVIDYAKSLNTATKAAKGALASFDDLNILQKNEGSSGAGGGEVTGADAFEEAQIDPATYAMLEKVKGILEAILPIVGLIGAGLLAWKVAGFLKDMSSLAPYLKEAAGLVMAIGGFALAAYEYLDMWNNGVSWGSLIKYLAGAALGVTGVFVLLGPVAAGISLVIAGASGLILAIKDLTANGLNAQNMTLLLISAGALLAGVFITLGGTAAVVVGAIMLVIGAVAALIAWTGNGKEALGLLQDQFKRLGSFLKHIFVGDWKAALADMASFAVDSVNMGFVVTESFVNGFIKAINMLIDAFNSFKISLPDWLPISSLAGKSWSPSVPNIGWSLSLPRLANGAVIEGGHPFAAILGDQPRGQTNVETPLSTIKEAVAEVMGSMELSPQVNVYLGNHQFDDYVTQLGNKNALRSGGR